MPRAGVLFRYPEAFTEADIVVERSFVFPAHCVKYLGVFPVYGPIAMFFVGTFLGPKHLVEIFGISFEY